MKKIVRKYYIQLISRLVRRYVRRIRPYVIGITGSVGKTTCRMIVTELLRTAFPDKKIVSSPKNFNGELGFLVSILDMQTFSPSVSSFVRLLWRAVCCAMGGGERYDIFVGEYGIDTPGEMQQLTSVMRPDIAIVTRVDAVHGEQLGDAGHIAWEKGGLVAAARDVVYLNSDDPLVVGMATRSQVDVLYYGSDERSTHRVDDLVYHFDQERGVLEAHATYQYGQQQDELTSNVYTLAEHQAIGVGLSMASLLADRDQQSLALPESMMFDLQPGRSTILRGVHDSVLFDSSYNAAPASMQMMISFVGYIQKKLFADYRLVLVLGEMRELGEVSQAQHEQMATWIATVDADRVLLVGNEVMHTYRAMSSESGVVDDMVTIFQSAREAGKVLREYIEQQDEKCLVLFKGSQNTIFLEEAIKEVLADAADVEQLGRQEGWWMDKKERFFAGLDADT